MTTAPPLLLAARRLLLEHLDMHPGVATADLDPAEVGVVGDAAHKVGGDSYHLGKDQIIRSGRRYSVDESPRDRAGLSDYASALDVGWFSASVRGKVWTLRDFSIWLVAQCKANAPDTRDIREIIYSPDGKVVKRWDRLGIRSSGDLSHLAHTHISEFRDARGRHAVGLLRRWLTTIGLIAGQEDDVQLTDKLPGGSTVGGALETILRRSGYLANTIAPGLRADLSKALGRDPVDEDAVAEALWSRLGDQSVDDIAAILRAGMTADKLAELAAALST